MAASDRRTPIEKFVQRAGALYSLPAVAMEVLQLTNSPKVDTAALKDCIERDPALVSKILRTVNSSLFGTTRNVSDLSQAVTLLGIKPLKLLVLGFSLPPQLLSGMEQQALQQYWRHALIKAVAARELAAGCEQVDADDAFLAGLLQDIGMLVLLKDLGEPYAQFLAKAQQEQGDLLMLELETLGFDHRLLSARLLKHWGLPEPLWREIAGAPAEGGSLHHAPQTLNQLLASADAMAQLLAVGNPQALAALLAGTRRSDVERWKTLAVRLQEKVDELAGVFEIALPAGEDFEQIVVAAHAQLAMESEEAALHLAMHSDCTQWNEARNLEAAMKALETAPLAAAPNPANHPQRPAEKPAPAAATATATIVSDPGLLGRLERAVAACRRRRCPLSLLMIEIDEFEDFTFEASTAAASEYVEQLRRSVQGMLDNTGAALISGDGQISVLLLGADRSSAVETARVLLDGARNGRLSGDSELRSTLSIGVASVALPAKNFPADALLEAAQRCLFGVCSSGGDAVKSIDIY